MKLPVFRIAVSAIPLLFLFPLSRPASGQG